MQIKTVQFIIFSDGHEDDDDLAVLIDKTKKYTERLKSNCSTAEASSANDKPLETQSKYYIPSHQTSHSKKLSIFKALIEFEKDCEMENIRAFSMVHNLKDCIEEIYHLPQNIIDDTSVNEIRTNGFRLYFKSLLKMEELKGILEQAAFVMLSASRGQFSN